MSQRVYALTGISGVGKTTFLSAVKKFIEFQHLTGGSLIAKAREASIEDRDDLRKLDVDENQMLLLSGFRISRDPNAECVIFDGHVVIDTGNAIESIQTEVFRQLDIHAMVHLEAEAMDIVRNRQFDRSRSRPEHSQDVLSQHQQMSRARAREVAEALGIEFLIVRHADVEMFANKLSALRDL